MFFVEGRHLHVYSQLPRIPNEKGERELTPLGDELQTRWKGEPYYHDTYELRDGEWVRVSREFSQAPDRYLDFGPCDPLNQIDLRLVREEFAKLLPTGAKLKFVMEAEGKQRYALIAYSDTPTQTVTYSLKLALALPEGNSWRVGQTVVTSDNGNYCGSRGIETKLSDGKQALVVLVYINEPAASSDYDSVYSFLIRQTESGLAKPKK